jgi:hypothetical protein
MQFVVVVYRGVVGAVFLGGQEKQQRRLIDSGRT